MSRKKLVLLIAIAAAVIAAIVWLIAGANSQGEQSEDPHQPHELETSPDSSTQEQLEKHVEGQNHPHISGAATGDEQPIDLGTVPVEIAAMGQGIADNWMTFDSKEMGGARESQLAAVISNPADWADTIPGVHRSRLESVGNPTWRSVSQTTSQSTLIPDFSYELDGKFYIAAQIPFRTEFSSGGGTRRGSVYGEPIWSFVMDADGNLVDVVEPTIPE